MNAASGGFPPTPPPGPPPEPLLPPADWYTDPDGTGQLRYWDGTAWTEHFAPRPTGLRSIGDWLGRTFAVAWQSAVPLLMLLASFGVAPAVIFGLVGAWLIWPFRLAGLGQLDDDIAGVDEFFDRLDAQGFTLGRILGLIILVGLWLLVTWALENAMRHQLYWAHQGQSPTWAESAKVGLKRLPRLILWTLPFLLLGLLILGGFTAAAFALIAADAGAAGAGLLVIGTLVAIPIVIFLAIRLWFFSTAVVVAPPGVNPWAATFEATRGHFWALLGRALLWGLITAVVGYALNIIQVQVTTSALLGSVGDLGIVDADSSTGVFSVTLDGRRIDSLGVSDLFSGRAGLAVSLILVGLANLIISWVGQALSASADANLYLDLGGQAGNSERSGS